MVPFGTALQVFVCFLKREKFLNIALEIELWKGNVSYNVLTMTQRGKWLGIPEKRYM